MVYNQGRHRIWGDFQVKAACQEQLTIKGGIESRLAYILERVRIKGCLESRAFYSEGAGYQVNFIIKAHSLKGNLESLINYSNIFLPKLNSHHIQTCKGYDAVFLKAVDKFSKRLLQTSCFCKQLFYQMCVQELSQFFNCWVLSKMH